MGERGNMQESSHVHKHDGSSTDKQRKCIIDKLAVPYLGSALTTAVYSKCTSSSKSVSRHDLCSYPSERG